MECLEYRLKTVGFIAGIDRGGVRRVICPLLMSFFHFAVPIAIVRHALHEIVLSFRTLTQLGGARRCEDVSRLVEETKKNLKFVGLYAAIYLVLIRDFCVFRFILFLRCTKSYGLLECTVITTSLYLNIQPYTLLRLKRRKYFKFDKISEKDLNPSADVTFFQ